MEEDLRIEDRVYIKPVEKYGIIKDVRDNSYWVDYEDEYGGKFWWRDALVLVEDEEEF
jgi:hypothetical protein